ncbi:MAG: hypothetical protein KC766_03405, partial [Myxococcales bacterium]|nr:hypothetical protein [Myxococcales bacterium]
MARNQLGTGTLLLFCVIVVGCKPDPVDDPPSEVPVEGTPLEQDALIPVEVLIGDNWVTVHPSQTAIEAFAGGWCLADNALNSDTQVCGTQRVAMPQTPFLARPSLAPSGFGACNAGLCVERAHTCAGFLLEEAARSPRSRQLDASTIGLQAFQLAVHLGLSELELVDLRRQ